MSASVEGLTRTIAALCHISAMIANHRRLPDILRTLAAAIKDLTDAHCGLVMFVPPSQPAEFYGPDEALAVAPDLIEAIQQISFDQDKLAPLHLTIPNKGSWQTMVIPLVQEQVLWGTLAAIYEHIPDDWPETILTLLGHQALIAMERWHLNTIVSQSYVGTIQALASAIDARDPSTHRHSRAVTELAVSLAAAINMDEEQVAILRDAAILHDIGKIGITENILSKPGPLTPQERTIVEAHPIVGVDILSAVPHMKDLIPLVLHHHERYNGSGYPDGLRGDEIPLGAHILAIVDSFDAITTERPYHRGLSIQDACAILEKEAGQLFHPELVAVFVRMIRLRIGEID